MMAYRIANLLGSPSLAPTKLDELKIKANILSSFAATKLEDLKDAAGDKLNELGEDAEAFVGYMQDQAGKVGDKIKGEL
jgi:protein disulfide-isomerase A6